MNKQQHIYFNKIIAVILYFNIICRENTSYCKPKLNHKKSKKNNDRKIRTVTYIVFNLIKITTENTQISKAI